MSFLTDFFSSSSVSSAGPASAGQPDPWVNILFIASLFLVMYFFVIRPQSKKQKALREMIEALAVGDEIVTVGGLSGKIVSRTETFLDIQIAENVQVSIQKTAVSSVLPKGTLTF